MKSSCFNLQALYMFVSYLHGNVSMLKRLIKLTGLAVLAAGGGDDMVDSAVEKAGLLLL